MPLECLEHVCVHLVWLVVRVNLPDFVVFFVKFDDWHGLLPKHVEPLLQDFHVVIVSLLVARTLPSLLDSRDHGLLGAVQEEHKLHVSRVAQNLFPTVLIVLVAGKSVDQELLLGPSVLFHSFFDQVDSDFYRHDFAFEDDAVDQLAVGAAAVSLQRYLGRQKGLTSSRSRSPADRWTNPCSLTSLPHMVPLPEPGPL